MNGKTNAAGTSGSAGVSIPLEAPTNLMLSAADSKISLTWTDPVDKYADPGGELVSQWTYDSVVRKQGSAPVNPGDGEMVVKVTNRNQYQNIPYVDTGMENDIRWYYSVFAHNQFDTPSEEISGSDIPTGNVVTELTPIWLDTFNHYNSTGYNPDTAYAANGKYLMEFGTNNNNVNNNNKINVFDKSLTSRQITGDTYGYPKPLASAMLNIHGSANNADDENMSYIDQNLIDHDLGFKFYDTAGYIKTAGIDNNCAYILNKGTNPHGQYVSYARRVDSNFTSKNVSMLSVPQTGNHLYPQSTPEYAFFYGAMNGAKLNKIYCYDKNGTTKAISGPSTNDNYSASTRCDQYTVFFGTAITALNNDLVSTQLEQPDLSGVGDHAGVNSEVCDTYSIGCGIFFVSQFVNTAMNIQTIDKNLIYRGSIGDISNIYPDEYIYPRDYELQTPINRLDMYLILPAYTNQSDRYGYMLIKNEHESNIEGE